MLVRGYFVLDINSMSYKFICACIFISLTLIQHPCMSEENTTALDTLSPCPDTPNCVSSQAPKSDQEHYIAAFTYTKTPQQIIKILLSLIKSYPRIQIITHKANYLHVTFSSLIFRFTDDVEFLFDDSKKIIHVRSASRTGISDLGVNRKRIEALRSALQKALNENTDHHLP